MGGDALLCNTWLASGIDVNHGAGQKGTTFWANILSSFHKHENFEPYCSETTHNHGTKSLNHH